MKVDDIVEHKEGTLSMSEGVLRSGCEWYPCAVVVSLKPFVLVSEGGDMLWSNMKPENYVMKHTVDTAKAFARWERYSKF